MADYFSKKRSHRFYAVILLVLTLWMSLPGLSSVQVIDRDEARFAQATVQMVESGDYLNIEVQDRARNKKPAGIYWLQAVFVKALTDPGERKIWTHRIVSVLGALLAVFATYWGALAVLGRRGAFLSAIILATTVVFAAEAHIAKTDAVLCGLSALCLACLLRLQKQDSQFTAFIFWAALGAAIMIKGPITPAIIILSIIAYFVWRRDLGWLKPLLNIPGILLAILMVVPWAIAIGVATDWAFYSDSVIGDMGSKIASGQESHGFLPGYYLATISLAFWPGILLLVPGLVFAKLAVSKSTIDETFRNSIILLICWILPFWIILELTPTKLVHYPLPLYPALSILAAGAFFAMLETDALKKSRKVSSVLFLISSIIIITAIFAVDAMYSDQQSITYFAFPVFVLLAFAAAIWMWAGDVKKAAATALILTFILTPITYQFILPKLSDLQLGDRIEKALATENLGAGRILSPNYTEPSLIYHLGTDILLAENAEKAMKSGIKSGDLLLVDVRKAEEKYSLLNLSGQLSESETCLIEKSAVKGTNYSKGDPVDIRLYLAEPCP